MGSWEGGRLFPGPGCSERGRPPWSVRPGSQPQMQKWAVRLAGRRGGPSAAPLSCFAPTGGSTHARPGRSSVCPCDPPPAAGRGSGSPHWWPASPPVPVTRVRLQKPVRSGDTDRRWSRSPAGARGPDHGRAEPTSLCPDLHAGEPPALHRVKPERFSSAPADCLSSGLISKTSLFTEEKLPFPPGCVSLPLIMSSVSVPGPPGTLTWRQVTGTTSPQTTLCGP